MEAICEVGYVAKQLSRVFTVTQVNVCFIRGLGEVTLDVIGAGPLPSSFTAADARGVRLRRGSIRLI